MTSQNGAPGNPSNSNLRDPAPANESDAARERRVQGLNHVDELDTLPPGRADSKEQSR